MDLLFELTGEELTFPLSERKPAPKGNVPGKRPPAPKVDAGELEAALKTFVQEEKIYTKRKAKLEELRKERGPEADVTAFPASKPATIWRRLGAFSVDFVESSILATLVAAFWLLPPEIRAELWSFQVAGLSALIPYSVKFVSLALALWFFITVFTTSTTGQTPGMKLFGLIVMSTGGGFVSLRIAVLRAFSQLTTALTFGLGTLSAMGRNRRMLHDYLAGTVIQKINHAEKP